MQEAEVEDRPTLGGRPEAASYERVLLAELDRRLVELAGYPDEQFGRIGLADGILVLLLFVLLPVLAVWIYR